MVIKGKSRTNGGQLAAYLLKLDGNERIQIIEHNSPHETLSETFRDWEVLADGVDGKKYLYHAQINPEARYAMTPEQYERAADVLETELRFTGQPRVIVFHEKDDGRQHAHVVWHRIDVEKMSLIDDGWNYLANERASLALEQEFGHELVPGKHAKRDRQLQPEFPREETNLTEQQQAKRAGLDPKEFKAMIQQLHQQSDNAHAFKTALEEKGFILASGERGYTLVDEHGGIYNLARQLKEKKAQVEQFMAALPLSSLPTVEEAKVLQREKTPEPEPPKQPEQQPTAKTPKPEEQAQEPTAPQPHKPTPEFLADLEKALKERHDREGRELTHRQETERKNTNEAFDDGLKEKLAERRALQKAELDPIYSTGEEYSDKWMRRFIEIMKHRWNPAAAEQQRLERQQKIDEIKTRHRIERDTMRQNLKMERDAALDDLKAIHDKQQADHAAKYPEELARYKQEHEAAQKLIAQMEEKKRQEELTKKPDEPDPPKPSL